VGARGGLSYALVTGPDFDGGQFLGGLTGGAFVRAHLTDRIAFQPEVVFQRKGLTDSAGSTEVAFKADYIEVPLQLVFVFQNTGDIYSQGTAFSLSLGTSLGFNRGCSLSVDDDGVSVDAKCGGQTSNAGLTTEFASPDVGLLFGFGSEGRMGQAVISLDLRFVVGMDEEALSLSSQTLAATGRNMYGSLTLGAAVPVG